MRRRLVTLGLIALAVALADQILKAVMVPWLSQGPVQVIPGFARLILAYNTGAAFSSFANLEWARWLLTGAILVALGLALWAAVGPLGRSRGALICLGLISGGAVGNLIDRLRLGKVIDFVDLYVGNWHWPVFNLADAAITIGGVWLAWLLIRGEG
ncbi:MAG: signal peptidase II [Desulfarculaceae bacterium]|nr:signal peptidase II [Desulfarculaceae bacterium]MCF8072527.1 signal peptidase II [Desulfarculaceae bacterium]MCF8103668.1 signal peptidase II [Desulfarculaceae bacterium]MCF8117068.1 signal peptidase II [Desulfarculaceae bacterium]